MGSIVNHTTKEVDEEQVITYVQLGYAWPLDDHLTVHVKEGVHPDPPLESVDAVIILDQEDFDPKPELCRYPGIIYPPA